MKKAFPFLIGTDPEFALTSNGKLINARRYLKLMLAHESPAKLGFRLGKAGILGWDALHTAELRPTPNRRPFYVVDNMALLLRRFIRGENDIDLLSKYHGVQLGGHIHLEFISQVKVDDELVGKLHQQMVTATETISGGEKHLEKRDNIYQDKCRVHYRKEYGAWVYEFLLPSAEWFTSHKLAESTLAYYATVFHHYTHGITHPNNVDIRKYEYYEHYKEEIDYVLDTSRVLKDKESINYSLITGWNLR